MAVSNQFKANFMAKKNKMKDLFKVDTLRQTLILTKDNDPRTPCQKCLLKRPACGDICMEASPVSYVKEIISHKWWVIILRFLRHLITKRY